MRVLSARRTQILLIRLRLTVRVNKKNARNAAEGQYRLHYAHFTQQTARQNATGHMSAYDMPGYFVYLRMRSMIICMESVCLLFFIAEI